MEDNSELTQLRSALSTLRGAAEEIGRAATDLVKTMSECHICHGTIIIEDGPIHCEDCSYDCQGHAEPECVKIGDFHATLKSALARYQATKKG